MFVNASKNSFRQPYNYNNVTGGVNSSKESACFYQLFQMVPNAYKNTGSTSGTFPTQTFMDVGFGDTAVSADDIKLADGNMTLENKNSGASSWEYKKPLDGKEYLTIVSHSGNTKVDGEIINKTVVYRNDTENTVTIKEVGIYWALNGMTYTTGSYWQTANGSTVALAFRKVLTTPIVMAPGDVYAITYRISLNI